MDAEVIATVMTQAQRQVIAPSDQAVPLSQRKSAVWSDSDEGQAAQRAERDLQRQRYEAEWGPQRWGA